MLQNHNTITSLQTLAFKSSINSELFTDEFQKLSRDDQLTFIKKLIDTSGYVSVTNKPNGWLKTHMVAHDFVYDGELPKKVNFSKEKLFD